MVYRAKTYTLKEEITEGGTRYSISFKDGQGEHHELEVLEQLFTVVVISIWIDFQPPQ